MKQKNTNISNRLFIEGYEIDLSEEESLRNGITYGLSSIQDISKKGSSQSKTINLPGTKNNNRLLNFLFDIKSTGKDTYSIPFGTAKITNNISGLSIVDIYVDPLPTSIDLAPFRPDPTLGFDFGFPITVSGSASFLINNAGQFIINSGSHNIVTQIGGGVSGSGSIATSFHNQIPNTRFAFVTSGSSDNSGYVICKLNGAIISTNKISSGTSTYYFPQGDYQFDDILEIDFQPNFQQFAGNIGYAFDPKKKAKAYVLSNNQVILSGYAKLISATSKNGQVSYSIQITSELGGLIGALGNSRLEDLFTTVVPDLLNDPEQVLGLNKTIDLPSPYDHQLTLDNISLSWLGSTPYVWPLIDYGGNGGTGDERSELTVNGTNFYTSVLRPCLYAKDYLDLIFASVGYTYDSSFFNSDYFENLIIPYKDGNFTIIDNYNVTATSVGTQSMIIPATSEGGSVSTTNFYIFNTIVSDFFEVYNEASASYNPPNLGLYNISTEFVGNIIVNASSSLRLLNPEFDIHVQYRIFASGSTTPYNTLEDLYTIFGGELSFGPNYYFISNGENVESNPFVVTFQNTPVYLNEGDYVIVNINPASIGPPSSTITSFPKSGSITNVVTGSSTLVVNTTTNSPIVEFGLSPQMDGQFIRYKDFCPKTVSQKEYIESLVKLFNLYPVQDTDRKNHFYFYTRDEFFNAGEILDWTNKLDINSDITVKVIPQLDSAKLLFSYKKDKDYFNKLYDSLYGNFSYGSLRVDTGYEFANKEKDVMKGILFAPTPIVQYENIEYDSEGPIEILNGPWADASQPGAFPNADASSTIVMASGYFAANGGLSPCDNMVSTPLANNFTGQKFDKIRIGVQINYWGTIYTVTQVYNDYAFQVDDGGTVLSRPITQGAAERISNVYYATNDGFTYITNNNLKIPAIYNSSDNNQTHKPEKSELRILYFSRIHNENNLCNPFWLQYTPTVGKTPQRNFGMFTFFNGTAEGSKDSGAQMKLQFPFCSHLNDLQFPTKDLLFAPPEALFYPYSGSYPTKNLYSTYWINTVNEITDESAKFVEASLKLNSVDVANLNLNETISINSTNYRINSINDFRGDDSTLTKCELIRQPIFQNVVDAPFVNAGGEQLVDIACLATLTLTGQVIVDGSVGQTLSSSLWTFISGPTGSTIFSPTNLVTSITLPGTGSYIFNLSATDNFGLTGNANTTILVSPHNEIIPFIEISSVGNITLPISTVALSSSIETFNCTVLSQSIWTQTAGTTATITSPTSSNTTVTGINTAGNYTFELTAVDNFRGTNSGSVSFEVFPSVNLTVKNSINSANITSFTGAGTLTPPFAIAPGSATYTGSHGILSSATIVITTDGTIPPGAFAMNYRFNGSLIDSQVASSGATYTFIGITATTSDILEFDLST